jgi:hypothetical protein
VSLLSTMVKTPRHGFIAGACAHCKAQVYESLAMLDDAYNVWVGRCPHCEALNFLALTSLRGYSSHGMSLVLPTDEEVRDNGLPPGVPTRGSLGPTVAVGTILGAIQEKLREDL